MPRDLERLGNAVRECLGLAPLYGRALTTEIQRCDAERFHAEPFRLPRSAAQTPLAWARGTR